MRLLYISRDVMVVENLPVQINENIHNGSIIDSMFNKSKPQKTLKDNINNELMVIDKLSKQNFK